MLIATSVSARSLSFKRRIVFESSVKVVSFKCATVDARGGGAAGLVGRTGDGGKGTVRKKLDFRMTVRSTVHQPVAVRAVVRFFDKSGKMLFETRHDQYKPMIASRKTQAFQWQGRVDANLIQRIDRADVYCGDRVSMQRRMRKASG